MKDEYYPCFIGDILFLTQQDRIYYSSLAKAFMRQYIDEYYSGARVRDATPKEVKLYKIYKKLEKL